MWEWRPAYNSLICYDHTVASVTPSLNENHATPSKLDMQGGNGCGHDPRNPKILKFPSQGRRPHVLEEAKRRLESAAKSPFNYPELLPLFYHKDKKGRQRRSEGREALVNLCLTVIVQTANLANNLYCGHWNGTHFVYYDLDKLVTLTGERKGRVRRALTVLRKLGLIHAGGQLDRAYEGTLRTINYRIRLDYSLFESFELCAEFALDAAKAEAKHQNKLNPRVIPFYAPASHELPVYLPPIQLSNILTKPPPSIG